MLSKEQLEKRIAEIRKIASEMKWSSVEHSQVALNDAEALEELLSLREQLAELKQQKPIGQVISCNGNKTLGWINDAPVGTLLFTAAKPADSVTLPAPANYDDYGPMISLEKTMAALALRGIEYTVRR
ncbi:hypothetical protein PL78_19115 [Yersinia entomophaga]|uniref:Ead/Ea22-like family protein n=1 Tax=Yersinia entomophaga TaxID=935293 RepID=A0ABM6BRF4_YERET|nr:hypothetical protein [Yersinia entomophaga]ANI31924.1 hypothetical protein PL78_19115 [Yersinia entomophaga]OWF84181.1 hypothetical protein B4914_19425 [Yersinia entomophaga]